MKIKIEYLSTLNERFAKLQEIFAMAMRHNTLILDEKTDYFLKVLAFFEKQGVLQSAEKWRDYCDTSNLAAHDYETDCAKIAIHFNRIDESTPDLTSDANNFIKFCNKVL